MTRSSETLDPSTPGSSVSADLVPARAQALELLGRLDGSGYRDAPFLVRRGDGQTFQLTPVLYRVLEAVDGRRSYPEIATEVSRSIGKEAGVEDVRFLAEAKLRPLGVLRQPDGSEPAVKKSNPLLALRCRLVVSKPEVTRRLTAPFATLFRPPIVLAVGTSFLLSVWWLLFEKGLASGARQALYNPALLLLVFALMVLSAGFHEFGHAAACRYGGATPGAMGVGLYLVWPVFYTDVTDAYRLSRRGRLRVDLGGLYFNAIFAVATFALWAVSGWDALLVVIPLQLLQMLHQLLPLVRLDGYHILADLTGVPDLFARVRPTLRGLVPVHRRRAGETTLKPAVGVVVTAWVLVVVPLLLLTLAFMVVSLPRLAATAWDSLGLQWDALRARWAKGDTPGMAARLLSMMAISVPVLSVSYLIVRITRRTTRRVWRGTADRPALRAIAVVAALSLLALVGRSWWPHGQYQPIQAEERGTVVDGIESVAQLPSAEGSLTSARADAARAAAPVGTPDTPTPSGGSQSGTESGESAIPTDPLTPGTASAPSPAPDALADLWRILIPGPSTLGEGDNQAVAINTEDASAAVALAFAIEWVSDGVVDNVNEAYALASCIRCLTMAIAFQAVLVLGPAELVIPENRAVAINVACIECFTYALAVQLVVSVSGPLSDEATNELALLRGQLESLAARVDGMTPEQIRAELAAIESKLIAVLAPSTGSTTGSSEGELAEETSSPESDQPSPETTPSTTTTAPPADAEPTTTSPSEPPPPETEPTPSTEPTTTTAP